MDLKIITGNEQYFVDVLNAINPGGNYTVGKNKGQQCPYHKSNETSGSDSFGWYEKNGKWVGNCFSCSTGGDIIKIYQDAKGVDFAKALNDIIDILHLQDDKTPPKKANKPKAKKQEPLSDETINELIEKAHKDVCKTNYFKERGFTDETIEKYKLGYTASYKIKKFDNGPGAIVPYPGETYYFTRMIDPKGDIKKHFLPGKQLPIFNTGAIKDNDIIWVTEGQFDCLSILQLGFPCVGTNSVTGNHKLIKYLKDNKIEHKVFIVAYDSDAAGDNGAEELISLLQEAGFKALRYKPSICKDINEMLVNDEATLLKDILDMQDEAEALLQTDNFTDIEFTDVTTVDNQIEAPKETESPKEIEVAQADIPTDIPKNYINDDGNIITGALVLYTVDTNRMFRKGNRLYIYNTQEGIYDVISEADIQQSYYSIARNEGTVDDISYRKCDNYTKTLMQIVPYEKDLVDKNRYIACKNGVIDVIENKLLPFDPKYKLDCKFNGTFKDDYEEWLVKYNNSEFYKFQKDVLVHDDTINTLQEMWGSMLAPRASKIQQVFIYYGDGSNGKSSLFDIQEALFYNKEQNICGISLGSFSEDKFILSMAQGKHINIVRDDVLAKNVGGSFKSAIAGEAVTTQEKNKNHTRQTFNMSWFYGVNELPNTTDKTYGYYRRNCIIPFNVKFGTEQEVKEGKADKIKIPGIVDSIIEKEMDIIFMWAYYGLQRLIKQNYKITPNGASDDAMDQYKMDTNSAYAFYKSEVVEAEGNKITGKELYMAYKEWCNNNFISDMGIHKFGSQIKSFGVKWKRGNKGMTYFDIDVEFRLVDDIDNPFDNVRQFKSCKK